MNAVVKPSMVRCVRIKMRSGGCATPSQNTDAYTGVGVTRGSWGAVDY